MNIYNNLFSMLDFFFALDLFSLIKKWTYFPFNSIIEWKNKYDKISKAKYRKLTVGEINRIINVAISANIRKVTVKWVGILEPWRSDVGYNYGVEFTTDKGQLEHEMIEFVLEIRTIRIFTIIIDKSY